MSKGMAFLLFLWGARCGGMPANAAECFVAGPHTPYPTLSSALAAMRDGDTCVIRAGVYRETLEIRRNRVTLRGEGRVVITGCDEAGDLQPCVVNGKRALKKPHRGPVFDLFCNGRPLMPARFPDKSAAMTSNADWEESVIGPNGDLDFRGQAQKRFPGLKDGYYIGMHGKAGARHGKLSSWYSVSVPITGVGEDGLLRVRGEAASSGFLGKFGLGKGLGYLLGAKAVLDAPGEWYADGTEVILIPPLGADRGFELRTRLDGAVITGQGVRLENLRFQAATLRVEGHDAALVKCAFDFLSPFRHTPNDEPRNRRGQSRACGWGTPENGTAGVFVKGDRFVAENCRFAKSWWCGMMVRGNHARIENCLFEDMNWMARRCAALFSWGDSNVVRYCTLRNLGGAGIEGGNAGWIGQYARNNIWEYNRIEDVCQLIVDQGFFYVNHQSGDNPKAGSVWRHNIGNGARGPVKGDWTPTTVGYYVDNSSSGYRVHHNIAINAREAIRYNDTRDGPQAGREILFHNNTFLHCGAIGFGCWNTQGKAQPDADVMLVNNLAVPEGTLDFGLWGQRLGWRNNLSRPLSALKDPERMDLTPVDGQLRSGGIPVWGQPVAYIGAVDPQKGMWRCGADESELLPP